MNLYKVKIKKENCISCKPASIADAYKKPGINSTHLKHVKFLLEKQGFSWHESSGNIHTYFINTNVCFNEKFEALPKIIIDSIKQKLRNININELI